MESIIYRILNTKNYIGSTNRGYHRLDEHYKEVNT